MDDRYDELIRSKIKRAKKAGFSVSESDMSPALFDFQRYIVQDIPACMISLATTTGQWRRQGSSITPKSRFGQILCWSGHGPILSVSCIIKCSQTRLIQA